MPEQAMLTRRGVIMAGLAAPTMPGLMRPARADAGERIAFEALYKSFGVLGLAMTASSR
jgi:hypothetical protein